MEKYITQKEVAKLLNLSISQTRLFLKEAGIKKLEINSCKEAVYDSIEINRFYDFLENIYSQNVNLKYSFKDLNEFGCNDHDKSKFKAVPTSLLDRYKRFKGAPALYEKSEVDFYLKFKNPEAILMNLKEIKKLTGFKSNFQMECALSDSGINSVTKGDSRTKYYKAEEIEIFQKAVQERYLYNQKFMYSTKQVKNLGLNKFDMNSLKTYTAEAIDRVYEYGGILALYEKLEVEKKLKQKELSTSLICEKDARELLGFNNQSKFKKLVEDYNIPKIARGKYEVIYYDEADLKLVKQIIDENYTYNVNTKITHDEIKELGYSRNFVRKLTPIYTKPIDNVYKFSKFVVFYDKANFLAQIEKESVDQNYYTLTQLKESLNYQGEIDIFLENVNIFPITFPPSKIRYWPKKEIDIFIKNSSKLYDYYEANYYIINELESMFDMSISKLERICIKFNIPLITYTIPNEIRYKKFYKKQKAFLKSEVDSIDSRNNYHLVLLYNEDKKITEQTKKIKVLDLLSQQLINFDHETKVKIFAEIKDYSSVKLIETGKFIISEKDFIKELDYSKEQFNSYIQPQNLFNFEYGKNKYYFHKECHFLYKQIIRNQSDFLERYYLLEEAAKIISKPMLSKDEYKVDIPNDLAFGVLKKPRYVYSKVAVDKQYNSLQRSIIIEAYKNLLDRSTLTSELFLEALNKLNLSFNICAEKTEKAWLNFATTNLLSSNGNIKTLKKLFNRLIRITELLQSTLTSKEATEMTANEINFTFFNDKIHSTYKETLYKFFRFFASGLKKCNYNYSDLKNPYLEKKNREKLNQNKKSVYSPEEFLLLLEYVKNVKLHKNKSIEETLKPSSNQGSNYESIWLYIMLHLNNAWRSTDFIEKIPRITLPSSINDYLSFKNRVLTTEEAEKIVWELISKVQNVYHNKNGKKAYFFISEEMIFPVANALILCELKAQSIKSTENTLINLGKSKELTLAMHNRFFKEFELQNFKFKSLKANRTFITYVNSILKKKTNRNPLEITKFIRNHDSLDTTNRYIHIEENHVNRISKELFDQGNFGYTYNYLKQLVIGANTNNSNQIEHKDLFETVFGDIYKIENLAIQFRAIEGKNQPLYEFVNNLSIEKRKEILHLITLKQLPAREAHWQCILGDCLYLDRQCESCPFAIPHFYALSKTIKNLKELLTKLIDIKKIALKGEKVRLVNLLYKNLILLSSAKKQFGEDVISAFLGKDYSEFLYVVQNLDEIDENLTIRGLR